MPADRSGLLIEQIKAASESQRRLTIQGHGSKGRLLPAVSNDGLLTLGEHSGILQYEPEELVITARGGTALSEIDAVLAEHQQQLACEPPQLSADKGTLGGAVASGLSGPGRPWLGAIRDAVLGVELINGTGEYLKFGGQVMKNVAGLRCVPAAVWRMGCVGCDVCYKPESAAGVRRRVHGFRVTIRRSIVITLRATWSA